MESVINRSNVQNELSAVSCRKYYADHSDNLTITLSYLASFKQNYQIKPGIIQSINSSLSIDAAYKRTCNGQQRCTMLA